MWINANKKIRIFSIEVHCRCLSAASSDQSTHQTHKKNKLDASHLEIYLLSQVACAMRTKHYHKIYARSLKFLLLQQKIHCAHSAMNNLIRNSSMLRSTFSIKLKTTKCTLIESHLVQLHKSSLLVISGSMSCPIACTLIMLDS